MFLLCFTDCGDPSPQYGNATYPDGTTVNQTATVQCYEGYTLVGNSNITCLEDGWNEHPQCSLQG